MKHLLPFTRIALVVAALLAVSAAPQAAQPTPEQARSLESRARAHIAAFAAVTQHGPEHGYARRDLILDDSGASHVRFDRTFRGMRVIGGDLVVHMTRNGNFQSTSQTLARPLDVDARAVVSAQAAEQAAARAHPGAVGQGQTESVVYARGDRPVLAWDVRVFGQQADGTPSELHVIVDARTGNVLESWDDIHTAPATGSGKGFFNGTVVLTTDSITGAYALRDPSRGGQYTVDMNNKQNGPSSSAMTDTDNLWGDNTLSSRQTVAVDAQYGTAVTWDYYKLVHGRNGIGNDGKGAFNRVHYGSRYNNAFWSNSCFCMTYGDGDGITFNPFDSLDVAGHEMTHGVTSRTANLTYSGESGGLNEATSDIFGTAVEFFANNPNDPGDYLIGEKLYKAGGRSLRSMIQPSTDGVSADCWYAGLGSLNVHYSSGVANHFFYLLSEGTTGGSPSKTCLTGNTRVATGAGTLTGIGRRKAEQIWYRALTVNFTSATNYANARAATIAATTYLVGASAAPSWTGPVFTSSDLDAVGAAWTAVGVLQ